jgi:hypothetical protein
VGGLERMANAGMELKRRLAALRHSSEALAMLTALQRDWLRMNETRPAAKELDPLIVQLTGVVGTLSKSTGEHWNVVDALRSIGQTLLAMGRSDLDTSRREVQLALDEIAEHRNGN